MKTLIISDVHERLDRLIALEPLMEKADRVVFLGDFWDSFYPKGQQKEIADKVKEYLAKGYEVCWGNHDCYYAFNHPRFREVNAGYNLTTQHILDEEMKKEHWRKFKLWTRVGKYVVSHAGFNSHTIGMMNQADEAINKAFAGGFHPLWAAGQAVGGRAPYGGPTWLRWWECGVIEFPQITGHTPDKKVRTNTRGDELFDWCIDTYLKHVAWVDEDTNEVTIQEVNT